MIKNAIAYITRKRNRTLIIFIIITIVLSCLYSCLTIMKSSNEIEKVVLCQDLVQVKMSFSSS